ncbi:OmpA family protein [Poseidonocella sedimentorum]|uniref:OmpA-OmpF porin, OOP family n=1 Tax=Poseidonocella sedimentorum TaxID=871652 RepID=A0A1I6D8L7_9RHOB|nr:OmpA family protein [Poseidonocella sedimentorum]SFR01806.1 OmpA-OmpF porin, OOP family [Poseidonocella sedimentorum]
MRRDGLAALALIGVLAASRAFALDLPSGAELISEQIAPDRYQLPIAAFDGERVPTERIEGLVTRQIWRFPRSSHGTFRVLSALRDDFTARGFEEVFLCRATVCGGYDFRFGIDLARPPEMIVNLQDFRYVALRHSDGRVASALASRSGNTVYLQLITAAPMDAVPRAEVAAPDQIGPMPDGAIARAIAAEGHAALDDLTFETGSTALGPGPFASLTELAALMAADRALRVVLVGHTDWVGSLDANVALSRARADAVRARLIRDHGVAPDRIMARGVGYLAPRASNETDAGRMRNRRVEAVLERAP